MEECLTENKTVEFVEGLLSRDDALRVEAHLDTCPTCLRVVSELVRSSIFPAPHGAPPALPSHEAPLGPGARVGRYRLDEMIGRGAMGSVYAAYDDELDRRVAIKVVRTDRRGSREHRARLLREARAIARVAHPNVVTVHDVGTIGDDLFVAMELVEGTSLRVWLAERRRKRREILDVLVRAGRGLAAAHEAGIVHRDVKPDNILVTTIGRVVVLDFGLARSAVHEAGGPDSDGAPSVAPREPTAPVDVALTATGTVLGTPAYMAPEQRRGGSSDARSDQFSFSVILYEALYGERPFSDEESAVGDKSDAPANRALREASKSSDVPPWLRRVVLRGLSAEPAARYASMDALVLALGRDPAATWRRRLVATAALVVAGGAAVAIHERRSAESHACDDAVHAVDGVWSAERQIAAKDAFVRTGLSYAGTTWENVRGRLDRYRGQWSALRGEVCTEKLRGGASGVLQRREACLDDRLGELEALTQVFAHADAKTVQNALPAIESLTPVARCADARLLSASVDASKAARAHEVQADIARARALAGAAKYQDALTIVQDAATRADQIDFRPLQAEAYVLLGTTQGFHGDAKAAETTMLRATVLADAAGDDRARAEAWISLIYQVGYEQGRHDAVPLFDQEAKAALERLGGDDDLDARRRSYVGLVLKAQGKLAEARVELEAAVAEKRAVLPPDSDPIAITLLNLGTLLRQQGEYDAAIRTFGDALAIFQKSRGDAPIVALVLSNIGDALERQKRWPEALDYTNRAVALAEAQLPPDHPNIAVYLATRADALCGLGRYEDARADEQRAVALVEKRFGADHPRLIPMLTGLGRAYLGLGKRADALAVLERAFALSATDLEPAERADLQVALARALRVVGREGERARGLAHSAEDAYRAAGDETEAAAVQAWQRDAAAR